MIPKLPRVVRLTAPLMRGLDIDAHVSAFHKTLKDGQLGNHRDASERYRETYGTGKRNLAKKAARALEMAPKGIVDNALYVAMWEDGSYDDFAKAQLRSYSFAHVLPPLVYPLERGAFVRTGRFHETAGLMGNWAIDFLTVAGTDVLACERGWITRLSGRPPSDDSADAYGIYGWSVFYETPAGYEYFVTHLGLRSALHIGQEVKPGTLLGKVGDQKFRDDHLHQGVSSPLGEKDARNRMSAVLRAPKIDHA